MLRKIIATSPTWFTVPVRLALAAVMIAHGSQKVLGTFNGAGFTTYISGNTPFGFMRPAWLWLSAAALSELVGGLFVGIGFLTRVGAFFIACVMLTAAPCFGSVDACRLKPEKVALGAPDTVAFDGDADVIRHSRSTTVLNDQSVPSCSCSVMSNRRVSPASSRTSSA